MTVKAHLFVDGQLMLCRQMQHVPSKGDTVRLQDTLFAKVTEVIWCFDEDESAGQRVNLRTEKI